DYAEGIENVAADSQAGLASPIFIRTAKLKDFPWNGWLRIGVPGPPRAAWNPIGGFPRPPRRPAGCAGGAAPPPPPSPPAPPHSQPCAAGLGERGEGGAGGCAARWHAEARRGRRRGTDQSALPRAAVQDPRRAADDRRRHRVSVRARYARERRGRTGARGAQGS